MNDTSSPELPQPAQLDSPSVITLPPNIILLALVSGIVLDWFFQSNFGYIWGWLGLCLLFSAIGVILYCAKLFKQAGTNIRPDQPTLTLIIDKGPYQYSRNPIYLSFLVAFAGLSFLADAPVMLLLMFPLFYVFDRHVIVPEEKYLENKFGDDYKFYKNRVRRWI